MPTLYLKGQRRLCHPLVPNLNNLTALIKQHKRSAFGVRRSKGVEYLAVHWPTANTLGLTRDMLAAYHQFRGRHPFDRGGTLTKGLADFYLMPDVDLAPIRKARSTPTPRVHRLIPYRTGTADRQVPILISDRTIARIQAIDPGTMVSSICMIAVHEYDGRELTIGDTSGPHRYTVLVSLDRDDQLVDLANHYQCSKARVVAAIALSQN